LGLAKADVMPPLPAVFDRFGEQRLRHCQPVPASGEVRAAEAAVSFFLQVDALR
jgi:hypothetical protein